MDDVEQEPVASGSAKDERESSRTATAEFRIPAKVSLTRPDIAVRRPAEPEDEDPEPVEDAEDTEDKDETETAPPRPAPAPQSGPWHVEMPGPAPARKPEDAPRPGAAGPTRVERLPVPSAQSAPPPQIPAAGSSGQWSVPWQGTAPPPPATADEAKAEHGRRWLVVLMAALVLVAGLVTGQLLRPAPDPVVRLEIASSHTFPGQAPALPWPPAGQSVVHVEGLGTMGSSGGAAPTPTASVAKVMTAYVYLRDHPLKPGEAGPVLTVSPQAAAQIPMRMERDESLLGVTADQKLTQRKALEALLIISANDVAHELARWDAGSDQAFVAKMNATAKRLGMTATRYTDPSGFDSGTVSTAADQVRLLRAAMKIPAFAEIMNNRMYVPDDGGPARQGGNFILGRNGVVGGKTGYTDAAGGNFVFAAHHDLGGVRALIVGAVMGQRSPNAADAVNAAERLLVAAERALVASPLAHAGDMVAWVDDGLGGRTTLRAASPVVVVGWPGLTVPVRYDGDPPAHGDLGKRAGVMDVGAARVPLKLAEPTEGSSLVKRLIRLG